MPAAATAAVAYLVTALAGRGAGAIGLPRMFTMALQAVTSGLVGVIAIALGVGMHDALLAVAVNWMLLIPLPQLIATVIDAVDGQPHAALTRATSLVTAVGGVVLGAAVVIALTRPISPDAVAIDLPVLPLVGVVIFCMLGAVGNALANGGGRDLLIPAAIIGIGVALLGQALIGPLGMSAVWASGVCAVVLGLVCAVWARRTRYSSTALALVGLTGALLPGLTVYQGIAAELAGSADAVGYFLHAALVGVVLGVGTSRGYTLARVLFRQDEPG